MTDDVRTPRPGRLPGWWWPRVIVAIFVATACGQAILIYSATHDPTFAIEPDYYRKAVAWDTTMRREGESLALGWRAAAAMTTDAAHGAAVRVVVTDSAGAPVRGALVRGLAIHNLDSSHPVALAFADSGDAYVARIAPAELHRGLWELRIDADRAGSRFMQSLRVDYAP